MKRRAFSIGCCCCGVLATMPAYGWEMPERFPRPEASTDEGGLWAMVDREESRIARSRFLLENEPLQRYVNDITCRLASHHCPDIRAYLVHTPFFNASMAPNGMLQLWSGLLLRITNEAQLAAIIGHEIGHYVAKHSLARFRDAKAKAAFGQFVGMFLGAAGAGGAVAGLVTQFALVASMFAYSREHEMQADEISLELMSQAGYSPLEAPQIWKNLSDEKKAGAGGEENAGSILFATHPIAEERMERLKNLAGKMPSGGSVGEEAFAAVIRPVRQDLLQDQLKLRQPGESLFLINRLLQEDKDNGQLLYFKGEAFRLRNGDNDIEKAIDAYQASLRSKSPPDETYRSLGLVEMKNGNREAARSYFRTYLDKRPNAEDAGLIRSYVDEDN